MIDGENTVKVWHGGIPNKDGKTSDITVDGLWRHLRPDPKTREMQRKWEADLIWLWSLQYDRFGWAKLEDLIYHGLGSLTKIFLVSGNTLSVTMDHLVATADGSWRLADDLQPGDKVLTNWSEQEVASPEPEVKAQEPSNGRHDGHTRVIYSGIQRPKEILACIRCGGTENIAQHHRAKFYGHCKKCQQEMQFKRTPGAIKKSFEAQRKRHRIKTTIYPKVDEVVRSESGGEYYIYEIRLADNSYRNFTVNGIVVGG